MRSRYPGALACRAGCSACCHQHLSVLPGELARISLFLEQAPAAVREAIAAQLARPADDPRCAMLDDAGRCQIYAARPMICRSHGVPLSTPRPLGVEGEPPRRDVCPLNFTDGPDVDEIDDDCVLDVDRVNAMLILWDRLRPRSEPAPLWRAAIDGETGRVDLRRGVGLILGSSAERVLPNAGA